MVTRSHPTAWQAAAQFRLARRWELSGDFRRARLHYSRVLELVPDHVPALHNLAVAELRECSWHLALRLLERLEQQLMLDDPASDERSWTLLDYTVLYNRAVSLGGLDDFEGASVNTGRLVTQLLDRLDGVGKLAGHDTAQSSMKLLLRERKQDEREEKRLLSQLEMPSVIFHASMLIMADPNPWVLRSALHGSRTSPPGILTRDWVRESARRPANAQPDDEVELSAMRLPEVPDPAPFPVIAEWYTRAAAGARNHYNRGCYFSRLAGQVDAFDVAANFNPRLPRKSLFNEMSLRAYEELDQALIDDGLLQWASTDPALAPLRERPDWAEFVARQRPLTKELSET